MKRAVIYYKGAEEKGYCNLDADGLARNENGSLEVWKGNNEIVGLFKMDMITAAYISDKKENG